MRDLFSGVSEWSSLRALAGRKDHRCEPSRQWCQSAGPAKHEGHAVLPLRQAPLTQRQVSRHLDPLQLAGKWGAQHPWSRRDALLAAWQLQQFKRFRQGDSKLDNSPQPGRNLHPREDGLPACQESPVQHPELGFNSSFNSALLYFAEQIIQYNTNYGLLPCRRSQEVSEADSLHNKR